MADVARLAPRERRANVGELMGTDSVTATAAEHRAVFAQPATRRARGVAAPDVVILEWTG